MGNKTFNKCFFLFDHKKKESIDSALSFFIFFLTT